MAARSFRMFGKKRGHRRTGSNTWGSLGEAAVFAVFLALGTLFLILLLRMPVLPEWRANHDFLQTTATVLDKRVDESVGFEGASYRGRPRRFLASRTQAGSNGFAPSLLLARADLFRSRFGVRNPF